MKAYGTDPPVLVYHGDDNQVAIVSWKTSVFILGPGFFSPWLDSIYSKYGMEAFLFSHDITECTDADLEGGSDPATLIRAASSTDKGHTIDRKT